jgi:hypothetical protein
MTTPTLSTPFFTSARLLKLCGAAALVATASCSSGPDYPEYDLAGDIPRHYQAHYVSDGPVIDGDLSDIAWRKADWTANFIQLGGATDSRPRFQSRAKMLWDREYLYLGVWMVDPTVKSQPISSVSFNGLSLFVTADAESGAYHLIKVEPGGQIDQRAIRGNPEASRLKPLAGMQHGVTVSGTLDQAGDSDKGWWAEFALPWNSLTSEDRASVQRVGAQWRVNFVRAEQAWSPYFAHELHDPELWGKVELVR